MTIDLTVPPTTTVISACPHSCTHVVNSLNGYNRRGAHGVRLTANDTAAAAQNHASAPRREKSRVLGKELSFLIKVRILAGRLRIRGAP